MRFREFVAILWAAGKRCVQVNTDRMAAEIAFNALLAVAPMLLLVLSATSRILGTSTARAAFLDAIQRTAGTTAGDLAAYLMDIVPEVPGSGLTAVVGILVMLWFSSAVFRAVRCALNTIWDVKVPPGLRPALRQWLTSLILVLTTVTLFMGVLTLSLGVSLVGPFIEEQIPRGALVVRSINFGTGFSLLTLVLLVILKRGPQVHLKAGEVVGAALLTASLYALANMIISRLIWKSVLASFYGAAGALIVILLWAYYGAHIVLFGAAYSRAYLEHRHVRVPTRWEGRVSR